MKALIIGLVGILTGFVGLGQAKFVKVSGKVTDAANNTPLVNATVKVEGVNGGAKTDVDGNFFLTLEEGKTYSLTISYIGYQPKLVNDIQAGKDNALNIGLDRTSSDLTAVVVKTSAKRETAASLYNIQRNASAISDAISAEVIKKSPDRNTSEVLRRVSGTSIQDNKFVVVRGLSERYNSSLLNNSILPSTEPDKKAFSFDIIPSSLIDNITIYKSPTPDLPGDFAGGAIKITG